MGATAILKLAALAFLTAVRCMWLRFTGACRVWCACLPVIPTYVVSIYQWDCPVNGGDRRFASPSSRFGRDWVGFCHDMSVCLCIVSRILLDMSIYQSLIASLVRLEEGNKERPVWGTRKATLCVQLSR